MWYTPTNPIILLGYLLYTSFPRRLAASINLGQERSIGEPQNIPWAFTLPLCSDFGGYRDSGLECFLQFGMAKSYQGRIKIHFVKWGHKKKTQKTPFIEKNSTLVDFYQVCDYALLSILWRKWLGNFLLEGRSWKPLSHNSFLQKQRQVALALPRICQTDSGAEAKTLTLGNTKLIFFLPLPYCTPYSRSEGHILNMEMTFM